MPWSSTITDVGSMGDRKYAYGTAHHSGFLCGSITIPMGRVDDIHFQQIQYSGACEHIVISGAGGVATPPWGTPTSVYQTILYICQCDSGVANYTWFALGKRG